VHETEQRQDVVGLCVHPQVVLVLPLSLALNFYLSITNCLDVASGLLNNVYTCLQQEIWGAKTNLHVYLSITNCLDVASVLLNNVYTCLQQEIWGAKTNLRILQKRENN